MSRGGKRPGAGRKKGGTNSERRAFTKKVADSGLTPLDYLLEVMRDIESPQADRIDAAKSAAPYVHSKMPTAIIAPPPPDSPVTEDDERLLNLYLNGLHDGADEG